MRSWSATRRGAGSSIALVPTMGALHDGHLALIERARTVSDEVVVSIFVNPLQFNEPVDFDSYPRPIDDDVAACRSVGVAAVYAPTAALMYPPNFQTTVMPGALAELLEGPMRPGHFAGVTTVVTKLFGAVTPTFALFGEKDYQQLMIITQMVADLDLGIEVIGVPTVREDDGLAKSSRNLRLSQLDREAAVVIDKALAAAATAVTGGLHDAAAVKTLVREMIEAEPRAQLEYVAVVDPVTLEPLTTIVSQARVLTAAWFGDVRLIDNRHLGAG